MNPPFVSPSETADTALEMIRENDLPPSQYGRLNDADYEVHKSGLFLLHMLDNIKVQIDTIILMSI